MNNMYFDSFINFLDAKANVTVWKSEKEKVFDGKVYELYNNEDLKQKKIKDINAGFSTLDIMIED